MTDHPDRLACSLNNWEKAFILQSTRWYEHVWHIQHDEAVQLATDIYLYKRDHGRLFH